jgi:hypothetical protein
MADKFKPLYKTPTNPNGWTSLQVRRAQRKLQHDTPRAEAPTVETVRKWLNKNYPRKK